MSLPLRNTARTYGLIAIASHRIVAAAFIADYAIICCRDWSTEARPGEGRALLSYHTALGVSVFVALRVLWHRMSQPARRRAGAHAGGALCHHFIRRDMVLRRMLSPTLVQPQDRNQP